MGPPKELPPDWGVRGCLDPSLPLISARFHKAWSEGSNAGQNQAKRKANGFEAYCETVRASLLGPVYTW